jgi:DNA-binding transcriptional regulator LsrR (DeoR family)
MMEPSVSAAVESRCWKLRCKLQSHLRLMKAPPIASRPAPSAALRPFHAKRQIRDRFALWTAVAVALVVLAYADPIHHLYMMHRYGSIGYSPF